MNLILIGYRGTGTSTVGQWLGLQLGWDWVDSDVEIELCAGKSIAEIFDEIGEAGFRDVESECLARLCTRTRTIVAVGGGAILRGENRNALRAAGHVVWLRASPETIHQRLEADDTTVRRRPHLTRTGGLPEIHDVLTQRTPIYRECADLEVDTEGKTPKEVADEIIARLKLVPDPYHH
jgi:shikimate kinase